VTFKQGDQVFYVPHTDAAINIAPLVGGTGAFHLPKAIQDELEAGRGVKKRAVVDKVLSTGQLRLVLGETFDTVLASPEEVEPLDVVTQIGDHENSKSIEDQLAEAKAFEANGPAEIRSRNTPMKRTKSRSACFCTVCKTHQAPGSIVYRPTAMGGWLNSARICLSCVVQGNAPG
jgi:hypothetical protein